MSDRRLSVSAIIVAYNGAAFLSCALDCVFSQTRTPDEVILVDDGSTDDTAKIAGRYPDVRYVRQPNAGPSSARNHGVRLSTCDIICFLDVDDFWDEGKLEREVALLENDNSLDIVQGKIVDVEAPESIVPGGCIELRAVSTPYHFVNLGSLSIRKSTFLSIGGLDEFLSMNEDTDWLLRAWESNARKQILDEVSLFYTIRSDSLSAGGLAGSQSLPILLKQHRDRTALDPTIDPKTNLKDFFIGFPDRSKRKWTGELIHLQFKKPSKTTPPRDSGEEVAVQAERQFKLARVWKKRGLWKQALESYRRFVELRPDHSVAHIEMGAVLEKCGDPSEVLDYYSKATESFPNEAELHKAYIDAIHRMSGMDEAFTAYDLVRVDDKNLDLPVDALVCVFVCRNEWKKLPYFLRYYRDLGITHFFAIDNESDDGTRELLAQQEDVHLWSSGLSFNQSNFGSAWFELVLRSHALGRWCVTVDVDEILYYPDCETVGLADYCATLSQQGKRVLTTVLLEMYSKQPVSEAVYQTETPFLETCRYFDRQFHHSRYEQAGPFGNLTCFFGGVRERVFGQNDSFCQSKVSLIKYDADTILAGGQHWTNLPREQIADSRGALLHFKYFSDFSNKVVEEVRRKEHYHGALQYKQYVDQLDRDPRGFTLYDPEHSVRLTCSEQLVELGIMKRAPEVGESAAAASLEAPRICSLEQRDDRPLWSVIVTVYDRLTHLPRCLESILSQAESSKEMQIEVIADFHSSEKTVEIKKIVETIGKGRIHFHQCPENLGHPHIFNLCLERAQGEWVHIVHDDDWLDDGFYEAIGNGIRGNASFGAAFCRYHQRGKQGEIKWTSYLEREEPGIISSWPDRIGVYCRLAFSSMVVKRQVYEELGGFSPAIGSAFDWDMWKRVSLSYPVWYEPEPLLNCGREGDSLTDDLMLDGQQIEDSLMSIQRSIGYWPQESRSRMEDAAREHYASYSLGLGEAQLKLGQFESAFRNLSLALKASRSKVIQARLVRIINSAHSGQKKP
jgi:glycosyltransferase involved in cell wall biosynthesis